MVRKSKTSNILRKLCFRLVEISDGSMYYLNRFVPDTGPVSKFIKKPPVYDRTTSAATVYTESNHYTYTPFLKSLENLDTNLQPKEARLIESIKEYIHSLRSLFKYVENWGNLAFYQKSELAYKLKKPIKNFKFPIITHYRWLFGFYRLKGKHYKVRNQLKASYKGHFGQQLNIKL